MAESNNKTKEKLPEKAGGKSTKAEPTPKKNGRPTKHSPPKASGMPKNPFVPSPKSRNNGDKAKEIHKILILKKQMARHLVGCSLVSMISRNG